MQKAQKQKIELSFKNLDYFQGIFHLPTTLESRDFALPQYP